MSRKLYNLRFPGGKRKALTLSYDDGVRQDIRLAGLCNQNGVKCTFNLNSGTLGRVLIGGPPGGEPLDLSCVKPEEVASVYAGHEVAGHGLWHSDLTAIGTPGAMLEIIDDRAALEKLSGKTVQSFAYPFGLHNAQVRTLLRMAGYRSARTVVSTGGFGIPEDFLQWDATCHHDDPRLMDLARDFCEGGGEKLFAPKPQQLFYLWGHAYEFDIRHNWDRIEAFLAYVGQFQDTVWFATNGEIVNYVEAYRSLRWSADGTAVTNPTATELWMSVGFDGVLELPAGETVSIPQEE